MNTLVLPDPLLTQGGPVTSQCVHCTGFSSGRSTWRHHGLHCSHVCVCAHHCPLQHLPSCVRLRCPSVPIWMNARTCGFLLAQGGITLTTRASRTPHHTLSSSHNLVRAPYPVLRNRPPHGSHMVQRLQAPCPALRIHTVPSAHRFRRPPPALSQVTLCQPRSLRLPRSSPLPNSWSVASLSMLHRRSRFPSPRHL